MGHRRRAPDALTGLSRPAGRSPLPNEAFVRATLIAAGWSEPAPRAIDFVYRAGEGQDPVGDAVAFFTRIGPAARLLRQSPPAARAGMLDRVAEVCRRHVVGNAVDFPAAAWAMVGAEPIDRRAP